VKSLAARSELFGALFLLTGCSVSIAREPPSDAPVPSAESAPAPASPQNTAPPTDLVTLEKPASECYGLAEKSCRNNKADSERTSMTARKVEAGRKAAVKRKAVEHRAAKAPVLQRLTEQRKAQEARRAEAARVANEAEEKRRADQFKSAFERGRSAWLSAQ
jgi:hypothetical protein